MHLSQKELVQLAQELSSSPLAANNAVDQSASAGHPTASSADQGQGSSDSGEEEREWNEEQDLRDPEQAQCDDVNGLSLSVRRRSYMGSTSVVAVFRAMFRLRPSLQNELKNRILLYGDHVRPHSASPIVAAHTSPTDFDLRHMTPSVGEAPSINAYFAHVQGVVPLLDEIEFRQSWARGNRHDRPWLALLNMVLAMGSLAIGDSDDSSRIYYARAKEYLDLDLLGIGCVESLQALSLLGGFYLHYKNAPNMAYAIMGAAYRIAIGLGLHRKHGGSIPSSGTQTGTGKAQLRRRIWWSLFCMDSWGGTTLGRPTLGRWDPQTMDAPVATDADKMDPFELALDLAREFCVIATRVQHRLCQMTPITIDEINAFDADLVQWYHTLPQEFTQLENCPASLVTGQDIMRNRYFNLRLLLHRPVLLRHASLSGNVLSLPSEEYEAIQKCRDIACEAIDRVSSALNSVNRLRAWSSVWYLYQSSMVLLLSILTEPQNPQIATWRVSVEKALHFFNFANALTVSAGRSRKVVQGLLEACTAASVTPGSVTYSENAEGSSGIAESVTDPSLWSELSLNIFADQGGDWDMTNWVPDLPFDWDGKPTM